MRPGRDISRIASITDVLSKTIAVCVASRITSPTVTSMRPIEPPGWNSAKSSRLNLRRRATAIASASPIASIAVVLDVGARPTGHASSTVPTGSATSATCASGVPAEHVTAISAAPIFFRIGTRRITSSVLPL